MRPIFAVLCDFALISADGKPTLTGIFDTIRAQSVPFAYPRFAFAARIEFEAMPTSSSHTMQITVQDPTGGVVANMGGQVTVNAALPGQTKAFFDSHVFFDGFLVQAFGTYTISLAVDGVLTATTQLNVIRQVP